MDCLSVFHKFYEWRKPAAHSNPEKTVLARIEFARQVVCHDSRRSYGVFKSLANAPKTAQMQEHIQNL
jgi:hypothetical protein